MFYLKYLLCESHRNGYGKLALTRKNLLVGLSAGIQHDKITGCH